MTQTNTKTNTLDQKDLESLEFWQSMVLLFENKDILQITDFNVVENLIQTTKQKLIQNLSFFLKKRAKDGDPEAQKMAHRLLSLNLSQEDDDSVIFDKFPDLTTYLQMAFDDFVKYIKEQNQK
jgi:hypothetical protein